MHTRGHTFHKLEPLDTATEWTPNGHQHSKCLQTRWYVADSPWPAILGLPSSSELGIVQLNCTVKLTSKMWPTQPILRNLQQECTYESGMQPNFSTHLQRRPHQCPSYLVWGYWSIPWNLSHHSPLWWCQACGTCATRKCPITMWPLVHEKLNEFINQGIIVPVEEPTDWVSSLAYSWKANGKQWCLSGPKGS